MEESSGAWLQKTLMRVCCEEGTQGLQLDSDTVSSLVSYCELATPTDAVEYLINIVGHESCMDIVEEYLKRRTTPPSTIKSETGTSMQAYQKPQANDIWLIANKNVRAQKQRVPGGDSSTSAPPSALSTASNSAAPSSSSNAPAPKKASTGRGKKGTKAVTMAEASKMMLFPQGKPCDCQATRHELVNNCLSCGKIVCQQEGEGPCNFCGALVLREGSTYAGLEGNTAMPTTEAEAAAQAFKDRLVEYDRNSASRTTVIDDQSDFFDIEGDSWVSEEEKQLLRKKQEEFERAEEERKKRVVVTIDLLGRKVVMADGAEESASGSILLDLPEKEKSFRVKASPDVREIPVFVNVGQSADRPGRGKLPNMAVSGRVQYEDSLKEALLNRKMELLQIDPPQHEWQRPRLMEGFGAFEEASQSFECA